jgi:hypothetical protein
MLKWLIDFSTLSIWLCCCFVCVCRDYEMKFHGDKKSQIVIQTSHFIISVAVLYLSVRWVTTGVASGVSLLTQRGFCCVLKHTQVVTNPVSYLMYTGFLSGIKRRKREADHTPQSNSRVHIAASCIPHPVHTLMAWLLGTYTTLILQEYMHLVQNALSFRFLRGKVNKYVKNGNGT